MNKYEIETAILKEFEAFYPRLKICLLIKV